MPHALLAFWIQDSQIDAQKGVAKRCGGHIQSVLVVTKGVADLHEKGWSWSPEGVAQKSTRCGAILRGIPLEGVHVEVKWGTA